MVAVTGGFSFIGRFITRELLDAGTSVVTLTGHPRRPHSFGDKVKVAPLDFGDRAGLVRSLEGALTLYSTYWIRFPRGSMTFEQALENTEILFQAARAAGVRKIVHIGVTGATLDSPLPYFRGKALQEEALRASGLAFAVIRPTLVFGIGDILVNNIAWFLRRFPLFAIPGSGRYLVQPVAVEDVARIAVEAAGPGPDLFLDAAGPQRYTFDEMVRMIAAAVGRRTRVVHVPKGLATMLAKPVGLMKGDIVLTRDEVEGLDAGLLVSDEPHLGRRSMATWLTDNGASLGTSYSSEVARHYR
ncbi:MAG: NAD(P)H-binding protein [Chloroflexi bacterium]|nr:NAD(P)H-binding protein [Chloroflexota bacterium]